jgi:hypothetical protein
MQLGMVAAFDDAAGQDHGIVGALERKHARAGARDFAFGPGRFENIEHLDYGIF